jgi:polysaccharide biosynthesis protein PslA
MNSAYGNLLTKAAGQGASNASKQSIRLRLYSELVVVDTLSIVIGFYIAGFIRGARWVSHDGVSLAVMIIPIFLAFALNNGSYSIHAIRRPLEGIHRALIALILATLSVLMVVFVLQTGVQISRLAFGFGIAASASFILVHRVLFNRYARYQIGERVTDELVIVDGAEFKPRPGVVVLNAQLAQIQADAYDPTMIQRLGSCLEGFDRVLVACPPERQETWALLLKGANIVGEIIVPQFNALGGVGIGTYHGEDTIIVSRGPLSLASRAKKRAFDIAMTVPAIIMLFPVYLLVAIAIKLESPGPVFFVQDRIGRSNRLFKIMKFRSMRTETCDSDGAISTQRDDDRITRVGSFLRKSSLDELPQLINVLAGDMSLVGPRPHALGSLAGDKLFWEVDEHYWRRHALKPGITGLAQIRGFRGATHESVDLRNRLRADLEYMEGWGLWTDIAILIGTVRVLVHRNAY